MSTKNIVLADVSAEEKLEQLYFHGGPVDEPISVYVARQETIKATLRALGIHYDWMGFAE